MNDRKLGLLFQIFERDVKPGSSDVAFARVLAFIFGDSFGVSYNIKSALVVTYLSDDLISPDFVTSDLVRSPHLRTMVGGYSIMSMAMLHLYNLTSPSPLP